MVILRKLMGIDALNRARLCGLRHWRWMMKSQLDHKHFFPNHIHRHNCRLVYLLLTKNRKRG